MARVPWGFALKPGFIITTKRTEDERQDHSWKIITHFVPTNSL